MKFTLPRLPYAFDALEPYIDAKTMEIHYTKHHQAYVDNLNKALTNYPELQKKSLDFLIESINTLPEEIQTTIRNNAGGHYNHSFFWPVLKKSGSGKPKGKSGAAILQKFGTLERFQSLFNEAAKSVFGSGWAWLGVDKNGELVGLSTPNQDATLMANIKPILGLDVWEHAYYLKYQNKRVDYITAWWNVVNWEQVEENYRSFVD